MRARKWKQMTSLSLGGPLIYLSAPPKRPPVLLAGPWQQWWLRGGICGWPCLRSERRTGSSSWTPRPACAFWPVRRRINLIVDRFQEDRKQAAAFWWFLPCHSLTAGWEQLHPCTRGRRQSRWSLQLQLVLHRSEAGWGIASNFRSASFEPLSQGTEVQDAHSQSGPVLNKVWGLVCHDRSERCILPCLHASSTQEVPEDHFGGRSLPISGSSVRPCTLTPHFHRVCGCYSGSSATSGHPHTELHRRLVDTSSIRADSGLASFSSHERVGVKTKHQEKCAFSITEDHLSGGVVWDSTMMQAQLSPAWIELILTAVARFIECQSLTVKCFQKLLGLMAAASNVIHFGLLYTRPLQWWLKSKGFSQRYCRHLMWHINCLKILENIRALKHFLPDLRSHHVRQKVVGSIPREHTYC